jgi:hypothetical protein
MMKNSEKYRWNSVGREKALGGGRNMRLTKKNSINFVLLRERAENASINDVEEF